MSSSELVQKQKDLRNLLNSLPNTAEFDPIANAIAEFSPKLAGSVTQAVIIDLQSRDATLKEASGLLTQVSNKADADARTLTFEKPRLVAAALTEALVKLGELRIAAKSGNVAEAAAKVEALLTLIEHVQGSIKAT
jgi:hypothetical protein